MGTTLPRNEQQLAPSREPRTPRPRKDVFPSDAARAALLAMYDAKLAQWPVHHEEIDIRTSLGRTHVVIAGPPDARPVILLHTTGCPAFGWAPVIAPLAERYRAYALDIIGDVGKSALDDPARHPTTGQALAAWVREVGDALGVRRSDVIGASFGGWLAMHYATLAPERVRRLALVVPMGMPSWTQTLRVLFRLVTIGAGRSPEKKERLLSWLMGDDPAARNLFGDWISEVIAWKCQARVPNPLPITAARLAAIRVPTLLILGRRDRIVGNAARAARRAERHIQDLEVEIVPRATHAVLAEEPERVSEHLLRFFAR